MNRWQTVTHRIVVSLSILVTLYGSLIVAWGSRRNPMLEGLIAFLILGSISGLISLLVRWILKGFQVKEKPDND